MLTILGKRSSINVRKVLWTCEEAGLAYQQEDYGSGFKPLDTPEFQRLNPNSLVPVLLDGDFVLWESNSICRYLARKAERWDLLPAEPQPAAEVEHWMDWQCGEVIVSACVDHCREKRAKPYGTRLWAGQAVSARLVGK